MSAIADWSQKENICIIGSQQRTIILEMVIDRGLPSVMAAMLL